MKKLFIFSIIFYTFLMIFPSKTYAEDKNIYAKVQTNGVMFYSSADENSALFEIPYSYFVKVEKVEKNFYLAYYKNLTGYVKKDQVKLMKGNPIKPYAENTFSVYNPFSLYQKPTKASAIESELDEQSVVTYYGKISGQSLNNSSSEWLYGCLNKNGLNVFGYVYAPLVNIVPTPALNTELYEIVSEEELSSVGNTEFSSLSKGTKIMLIVSISVPSVLILYFLIKPSKVAQVTKNRKQIKKESRRISHGDYFEFDESQL